MGNSLKQNISKLNKFRRTEIIQSIFFDHKRIRAEIIDRKTTAKYPSTQKLKHFSIIHEPKTKPQGKLENILN